MIVADSSYLVDSLLKEGGEFEREQVLVPDLAVAEAMNAFTVQERVLHLIDDGRPYVERLFDGIESGAIEVVGCSRGIALDAYDIGARNMGGFYDCIFVALALRLGSELKTHDRRQAGILEAERARRGRQSPSGR